MSIGIDLTRAETMGFHKLMNIIKCYKAVEAEDSINQLNIVANPKLLDNAKSAKKYGDLFKAYTKTIRSHGIKQVTQQADLSQLIAMRKQMEANKNGGK